MAYRRPVEDRLTIDELYSKYKDAGLNTNLQGMRDQYICHVQIVSVRSSRKPTWNLDEWRPNVGYAQTVNSACNPGGPARPPLLQSI